MKIKKILIRGLIVLLVLIVIGLIAVGLSLGSIVKKGVELYGPQITKVTVHVDSVDVGLMTCSGKVKGLIIGNPEGYTSPQAISLGVASASISPASVFSDKIVIKSVRLEAPDIILDGGILQNNLTKLLDNVKGAPGHGQETQSKETLKQEGQPSKKFEVDDLFIIGAKVHVIAANVTLPIPEIHLTNLGTGPDGITAADLTQRVLDALIGSTIQAATAQLTGIGKGAGKAATDAVGKATKGLGNLFK